MILTFTKYLGIILTVTGYIVVCAYLISVNVWFGASFFIASFAALLTGLERTDKR